MLLQYYKVLPPYQSVLLQYYKVPRQYYKVLLQYYPLLQSPTPVLRQYYKYYSSTTPCYKALLRTTKYYASTTKYYSVLRKYYSVLQSTTPVLLWTTKYYSSFTKYYASTTKYYKVLRQYYSSTQTTTPVLLRTSKYYSKYYSSTTRVLLCTTKYYSVKVLRQHYSGTTPYYKVLLRSRRYYASTTKYYASTTPYYKVLLQVLRLPRKVTLELHLSNKMTPMLDPPHIWNVIYNACSNRCHDPTSPNTAPATQKDSHASSSSHMKHHLQCAQQQVSRSNLTKYCACHAERLACLIVVTYETSFTMGAATGVTIQPRQILHLPRRKTRMLCQIWNVIYNARSNRCHHPTSPNTAPATKNNTATFQRKFPKTDQTSSPMRGRSDHDPRMIRPWNRQTATRLATEVTFQARREHFLLKNTTFRAQSYIPTFTKYCTCHEMWHLNFTK